jgi:hypothetical protein
MIIYRLLGGEQTRRRGRRRSCGTHMSCFGSMLAGGSPALLPASTAAPSDCWNPSSIAFVSTASAAVEQPPALASPLGRTQPLMAEREKARCAESSTLSAGRFHSGVLRVNGQELEPVPAKCETRLLLLRPAILPARPRGRRHLRQLAVPGLPPPVRAHAELHQKR